MIQDGVAYSLIVSLGTARFADSLTALCQQDGGLGIHCELAARRAPMAQMSLDITGPGAEPGALLTAALQDLDYAGTEGLFDARESPRDFAEVDWLDKGDWLVAAHNAQVSQVFFLDNNPVAVFLQEESTDPDSYRHRFNRAWSLARPRLLFFARPGELAVYDLAQRPPRSARDFEKIEPLAIAQRTADVAERLQTFRRQSLETGRVFMAEHRFGDLKNRADKALIRDLKEVRKALVELGLSGNRLRFAHSLIGRSIFIRYLEDRGILTPSTFNDVARGREEWRRLLANPPSRPGLDFSDKPSLYARALEDKDFTFALFRRLAEDLNGDIFSGVAEEERVIGQEHLEKVQSLLFGDTDRQSSLFFYAYDFKIVPIDLISSIYEEFYHHKSLSYKGHGAHYTPPVLVEFLVEQVLSPERLASNPRILDLSCGSGIFLVEAFRRIVRSRIARQGRRLRFDELKKILRDQLRGIDVNPEAIRVAAFSLYLALLHYLEPPDIHEQIRRGNRLPKLVANGGLDSFNSLLAADAFDEESVRTLFPTRFDVVIGNPPWGSPGTTENEREARRLSQIAMDWCQENDFPVGDRERSQAFIWRTVSLLAPGGIAALLVSSGVLLKHHDKSVEFRRRWLDLCRLTAVFNFIHPRKFFFKSGVAPFVGVVYSNAGERPPTRQVVQYWSARKTMLIQGLQSIVFNKADGKSLSLEDDLADYQTWKAYWWGNHRDKNLVFDLQRRYPKLADLVAREECGRGWEKLSGGYDSEWLSEYRSLPTESLHRYGTLDVSRFEDPPLKVYRRGRRAIYDGRRILVKRGIDERGRDTGAIVARIEETAFCFKNSIHGVKLSENARWRYRIILGVLWSSLAKHFFFITGSSWGVWHHELHLDDEILSLPICLPEAGPLRTRLIRIVGELQRCDPASVPGERIHRLEKDLDDAVFELYGLGEAEVDLIRDMCDVQMDFFYNGEKSVAAQPIDCRDAEEDYCRVFRRTWSSYLDPGTELRWRLHSSPGDHSMLAAVFTIHDESDELDSAPADDSAWEDVLKRLDTALLHPVSSRIYLDGMVRAATRDAIIVVKRNEKRFWTRSMAREDAEATLAQAMIRDEGGDS